VETLKPFVDGHPALIYKLDGTRILTEERGVRKGPADQVEGR
jgi:hypothetical protein